MTRRKKTVRISESEWSIMEVLWENDENMTGSESEEVKFGLTLGEIVKILSAKSTWTSTTIRTLLIRLSNKKAVNVDKTAGVHKYSPAHPRSEYVNEEINAFVSRVFNNSPCQLITSLIKSGKLSVDEKKEIMDILKDTGE